MGKAEGPECKSDWNFDYHGIILLKEISWTKSTGLWTDERAPVHGSTVDRASYPFRVLIWGAPFGFNGWEEGDRGNSGCGRHGWLHGGGVTGSSLERCSSGRGLAVSGREWGRNNGEVGSALIRDGEAFWWQCDGSGDSAVESFGEGVLGSGERAK
jgi:hypothetical protein